MIHGFPSIRSAVTPGESMALQELATGGVVLELGAHLGYSTIVLASTASEVHSVDWHRGDGHAGHEWTALDFFINLKEFGSLDKVVAHVGRFEQVLPFFREQSFHGIFIDAFHEEESVTHDIGLALPLLKPYGWMAFHDYGREPFTVTPAVDKFAEKMGLEVHRVDWLAYFPHVAVG